MLKDVNSLHQQVQLMIMDMNISGQQIKEQPRLSEYMDLMLMHQMGQMQRMVG